MFNRCLLRLQEKSVKNFALSRNTLKWKGFTKLRRWSRIDDTILKIIVSLRFGFFPVRLPLLSPS